MSIYVACSCGQAFGAPENLAGKTVACPACKQPLSIPMGSSLAQAQLPSSSAVFPPAASQYAGSSYGYNLAGSASASPNYVPWIVGGAGAVVVILILAIVANTFLRRGNINAPNSGKSSTTAMEYKNPWTSSDGKFMVQFSAPATKVEERKYSVGKYDFLGVKFSASTVRDEHVWEYRIPEGLSPDEGMKIFLTEMKESYAKRLRLRFFFSRSAADFEFAGKPAWRREYDYRGNNDETAPTREDIVMVSGRIYVVHSQALMSRSDYKNPTEFTKLDARLFESMKAIGP